jgi:hypothetical protein
MFIVSYEPALALVALHGPGGSAEESMNRMLAALRRLHEDALRHRGCGRFVVIAREGATPPSPAVRAEIGHLARVGPDILFVRSTGMRSRSRARPRGVATSLRSRCWSRSLSARR